MKWSYVRECPLERDLRIMLVDDHEVVRLGLKALLSRYPRFDVVAEAGTADEALARARVHKPDVVVMDVRLPGKSGIDATREIVAALPETRIIILTSSGEERDRERAQQFGIQSYFTKPPGPELIAAVFKVLESTCLPAAK